MTEIHLKLTQLLEKAIVQLGLEKSENISFSTPGNPAHGDLSTNLAMQLYPQMEKGKWKSPREFAQALINVIDLSSEPDIESITVAGPGFINFSFSSIVLQNRVEGLKNPTQFSPSIDWNGKKVVVEFTDPNPFKELHIGHLYSNIVGEAICKLLETQGAIVKRVCYQGDVGMHVAKSVWGMLQTLGNEKTIERLSALAGQTLDERVKFLGKSYAMGATAYEEDESAKEEIKQINFMTFRSAQEALEESIAWKPQVDYASLILDSSLDYEVIKTLYTKGRTWSLDYFNTQYERLGMQFSDFYFESVVGEYGIKIVKEYLSKGIFEQSKGAIIFPGSKYGLHDRVFINSLGLPTYEAKELGLAPEKEKRFPHDFSLIITGNEINEYFKVLLSAMQQTFPELAAKTRHISHGMVKLPEGKMSSRTGKILTAQWLLDEAQREAKGILAETKSTIEQSLREEISEQVGLAAVKYALLKSAIGGDISFSFQESLSFNGSSGPYLQYTAVRCQSVLVKGHLVETNPSQTPWKLHPAERQLALHLYFADAAIFEAATHFAPHLLCTYLYSLAQLYNSFYNTYKVIGSGEEEQKRLLLTQATKTVLTRGCQILGIQIPSQM